MDFKAGPVLDQGKFSKGTLSTWKPVSCHLSLSVAWMEQGGMASLELLNAALGKRLQPLMQGGVHMDWAREDGEKCLPNRSSMTKTLQLLSSHSRVSNSVKFDPHKELLGALQSEAKSGKVTLPCVEVGIAAAAAATIFSQKINEFWVSSFDPLWKQLGDNSTH